MEGRPISGVVGKFKCPLKKTQPFCPRSTALNWTGKGLRHNRLLKLPKYVNHLSKTQINHSSISNEVLHTYAHKDLHLDFFFLKKVFVLWNSPCNKTKMVWNVDAPTTRRDLHIRVLQQYLYKHKTHKLQETNIVFSHSM